VRIDIAGGWSDTPPICYEMSGAVLNASVLIDGTYPIRCVSKITSNGIIRLRSLKHLVDGDGNILITRDSSKFLSEELICYSIRDFDNISDTQSPCALLKAVLVILHVVEINGNNLVLNSNLISILGSQNVNIGLDIACLSDLPAGFYSIIILIDNH
jgi:fucokinase